MVYREGSKNKAVNTKPEALDAFRQLLRLRLLLRAPIVVAELRVATMVVGVLALQGSYNEHLAGIVFLLPYFLLFVFFHMLCLLVVSGIGLFGQC